MCRLHRAAAAADDVGGGLTETAIKRQLINRAKITDSGHQEDVEGSMPTLLVKMQALLERVGDSDLQLSIRGAFLEVG